MSRDNAATVAMVDASFYYTYEYQGNAPKLVIKKVMPSKVYRDKALGPETADSLMIF
jgi:hypothetical protein